MKMERPAEISKQKSNDSGRNLSMLDNAQLADILKLTNKSTNKSTKSIKNYNNNNFTIVKSKSVSNNLVALQYFKGRPSPGSFAKSTKKIIWQTLADLPNHLADLPTSWQTF